VGTLSRTAQITPDAGGFRRFWRALRQLFHEVTAAVFAVLAFSWLNSAFRAWTRDTAHWLIALAVAVGLLLAFFAATQYLRSRRL
jgi:multisubunit Na+/H+ antiporter MnhB subunit